MMKSLHLSRKIGSDPSISTQEPPSLRSYKLQSPDSLKPKIEPTLESPTISTADSVGSVNSASSSFELIENEAAIKRTLALRNNLQNKEDVMHVALYATIAPGSMDEHQTQYSTMKIVPLDVDKLKKDLSYYQNKLYRRYSVKLDDLVKLETLGKGAFGEVTRVFNKTDRQFYALKEVQKQNFKKPIYFETAIWTEIQNLLKITQLKDSSLLKTALIDFDEKQDTCYLLMELGNGTLWEFAQCMRKYGLSWTERQLEYVLSQLIDQVLKLKKIGMCHRDIKPSNVIISRKEDSLKLSDFGGAIIAEEGIQKLNITGTPHFMAPELIQAVMKKEMVVEHDPFLSDLYSIGVTIITLLEPSLKRKDFKRYMKETVKEQYPILYPILRDLLGRPERRVEAVDKVLAMRLSIQGYQQMESETLGAKYKLYLYLKIVSKNKDINTSFYFDMFILDDAQEVIKKQIYLLSQEVSPDELNLQEVSWRIRLARCYYMQMNYEESLKELTDIMKRKELKSFEPENVLTKAETLLWLGIVKVKLGRIEEAVDDLLHCLGTRMAELGDVHEDVSAVLWQLGNAYLKQENLRGATKVFKQCIEIGEKLEKKGRKHMAKSYNSLGLLAEAREDYDKALDYFEKAKKTAVEALGKHHPVVADQYLAMAHTYIILGKTEEGVALCDRALEIKIKWCGESNPEVADAYVQVAKVYEKLGQYKKVTELLYKSVGIWRNVSGEDSQEIAGVYQLLGNVLCRKGRYKKGMEYANKVLENKEKYLGEGNTRLAGIYLWHAETCSALYIAEEKAKSLEKFIAMDYGKLEANIESAKLGFRAAKLLAEEDQIEKAWEYLQKGFELCKELAVPKKSNVYACYYEAVGRLRRAEGKPEFALENVKRAIETRNKVLCKDHDIEAGLYGLMGDLYEDLGEDEKAVEWRRKNVDIVEKYLSKGSTLMLVSLVNLARGLEKIGEKEEYGKRMKEIESLVKKLGIEEGHPLVKDFKLLENIVQGRQV